MYNFFDKNQYVNIRQRVERLQPNSQRLFGRMEAAQMMAHCSLQIETALGKTSRPDVGTFFTKHIIRRVLPFMTKIPMGTKTSNSLVVKDERNFDVEKKRLLDNIEQAHLHGVKGNWHPHIAFGKMSGKEWGHLIPLHLDHHLRQFSN